MIGERQPYAAVDLGFVGRVGVFERLHKATQFGYEVRDFFLGHTSASHGLLEPCLRQSAPGLGLFHPAGDEHRIGARFERGAVPTQLGVALDDLLLCLLVPLRLARMGGFEFADSGRERDRVELA